jgi:hypothetical protein
MMKTLARAIVATFLLLVPAMAQASVSISISPGYGQIVVGQTLQFSATVSGTSNQAVTWQVNNANGGSAAFGTVNSTGLFTASATLPNPAIATITAVSQADPTAFATATVTLLAHTNGGNTYYVATSGNDGNSGSSGSPWKTVQHAADTAKAGDTVLVHGGVFNEHVSFTKSGSSSGGYITFASAPGELATLDGTGLDIPQNMWGLATFTNASYVVLEGFEIRNYTTNSIKNVPIGIFVTGAGSSVQLVNNSVHDITTTAKTTPKACASDAFGITVYGTQAPAAIDGLAVSGNEIFNLHTGCSETLSLDGNVTNWAMVNNRVHDDDNIAIGAIGFEKVSKDPVYDQARQGVIRGNTVYNITSFGNPDYGKQYAADGIYIDGGTNITIEQNLIHNVDLGIELASEHKGRTSSLIVARNNVIYNGNSAGISIGGYAKNKGGTDHCQVVGNTLYNNDGQKTGSGEFQIQFNATNNVFENNILYAGAQNLLLNDFTTSEPDPSRLDYNLYFSVAGANKVQFTWQKHKYKTYASYLTGSGNDGNSPPFSDPQFVSLDSPPDLDIGAGSPARNVGAILGSAVAGAYDFAGNARVVNGLTDLGSYQHQSGRFSKRTRRQSGNALRRAVDMH